MQTAEVRSTGRVVGIDAFRVLASLSTVWLHSAYSPELINSGAIGRFAVPFFCFVAGLFIVAGALKDPNRSIGPYASQRFKRLYLPFLFWTVVYFAARKISHVMMGTHWDAPIELSRLWAGSMHHLWFLPFLLLVSLLAFPIVRFAVKSPSRELAVGLIGIGIGLLIALNPTPSQFDRIDEAAAVGTKYFLTRSWDRAPSFIWGVSFGLLWGFRPSRMRLSWLEALAGGAAAVACITFIWLAGRNSASENMAGLGMVVLAFGPWSPRVLGPLAALAPLTYGIYLAHPLFTQAVRKVGQRFFGVSDSDWRLEVITFLVAAVASIVLTLLMRKSRWTRWAIPAPQDTTRLDPLRRSGEATNAGATAAGSVREPAPPGGAGASRPATEAAIAEPLSTSVRTMEVSMGGESTARV